MAKTVVKKEINLLAETIFPLGMWDKLYLWVINVGRFLMMIVEVSTILLFFVHIVYDEQLINLQEHIKGSMQTLDNLRTQEIYVRNVSNILNSIGKLEENKRSMYDLNNQIYSFIPGGIFIKTVSINRLTVSLTGYSIGYTPIKILLNNIKDSALVQGDSVRMNTNQKQGGEIMFDLSFEFKE